MVIFVSSIASAIGIASSAWGQVDEGLATARQSLGALDESHLAMLVDDEPWRRDHPTVLRILSQIGNISLLNLRRYADQTSGVSIAQLLADPATHRIDVFEVRGRAVGVQRVECEPELADVMAFDFYYEVEVIAGNQSLLVVTRHAPSAWLDEQSAGVLGEEVSFQGYFLMRADYEGQSVGVLVAPRVAWHPADDTTLPAVRNGWKSLARAGVDVGMLENIDPRSIEAIAPSEGEVFFQMLRAVLETSPRQLDPGASTLNVVSLVQQPQEHVGQLYQIEGNLRRVTPIAVNSEYYRQRFGIDQYFQLDIFVPMGDQRLVVVDSAGQPLRDDRGNPLVYQGRMGVTVNVPALPEGLDARSKNVAVRMPGYFFKLWNYRSPRTRQFSNELVKPSPFFVGSMPQVVDSPTARTGWLDAAAILMFCALAGGVAWLIVWTRRGVRRARRGNEPEPDLDQLDIRHWT